ncbi:MAG: hypothetical protein LUH63_17695 [Parabacteroides sp.]|nr:hypothetical protein [Parabacteroides sp.]
MKIKAVNKIMSCLFFILWVIQADASPSGLKVNIRDYGAKGNGKALNTVAFNQAVQACVEQGGVRLLCLPASI